MLPVFQDGSCCSGTMLSFDTIGKTVNYSHQTMNGPRLEHNHAKGNHLSCASLHSIFHQYPYVVYTLLFSIGSMLQCAGRAVTL